MEMTSQWIIQNAKSIFYNKKYFKKYIRQKEIDADKRVIYPVDRAEICVRPEKQCVLRTHRRFHIHVSLARVLYRYEASFPPSIQCRVICILVCKAFHKQWLHRKKKNPQHQRFHFSLTSITFIGNLITGLNQTYLGKKPHP